MTAAATTGGSPRPRRSSSPARHAGSELLKTSVDPAGTTPLGTLNNCAGGVTPWGTVLSGEENIDQYFGAAAGLPAPYAASYDRYGFSRASAPNADGRTSTRVST